MTQHQSVRKCRLCNGEAFTELINFGQRPITKRLLATLPPEDEFTFPLTLHVCNNCGFVQILDVIPQDELYSNYELRSSWKSQPHINNEIECLFKNNYITKDSFVIEIGCNDGNALSLLKDYGVENLLGIEPSRDVAKIALDAGYHVINDYFSEDIAAVIQGEYGRADLIICRQVLEHISYIDSFMKGIRTVVKSGKYVLFEVPDFSIPLICGDVSAIWEEHVNYFTEHTISHLLTHYGYAVMNVSKYNFSGGALCVIAKCVSCQVHSYSAIREDIFRSILRYPINIDAFVHKAVPLLNEVKEQGGKIAIYGAGNRTVILLNYIFKHYVDIVIDDQPEKQNRFIPMCHLPILPPSELIQQNITLCLLAVNAENEEAVIDKNYSFIAAGGRFLSILSPSSNLLTQF